MDAKETVQKGLDARKNVKAAEARAERYRETVDVIRDALFREQMSHKRARSIWVEERTTMEGIIYRQNDTIADLRQRLAAAEGRARKARQIRAMIDGSMACVAFVALIWTRDLGWIAPNLSDSLTALSLVCLGVAVFTWSRNK